MFVSCTSGGGVSAERPRCRRWKRRDKKKAPKASDPRMAILAMAMPAITAGLIDFSWIAGAEEPELYDSAELLICEFAEVLFPTIVGLVVAEASVVDRVVFVGGCDNPVVVSGGIVICGAVVERGSSVDTSEL